MFSNKLRLFEIATIYYIKKIIRLMLNVCQLNFISIIDDILLKKLLENK
jgi:hypothetical protein